MDSISPWPTSRGLKLAVHCPAASAARVGSIDSSTPLARNVTGMSACSSSLINRLAKLSTASSLVAAWPSFPIAANSAYAPLASPRSALKAHDVRQHHPDCLAVDDVVLSRQRVCRRVRRTQHAGLDRAPGQRRAEQHATTGVEVVRLVEHRGKVGATAARTPPSKTSTTTRPFFW